MADRTTIPTNQIIEQVYTKLKSQKKALTLNFDVPAVSASIEQHYHGRRPSTDSAAVFTEVTYVPLITPRGFRFSLGKVHYVDGSAPYQIGLHGHYTLMPSEVGAATRRVYTEEEQKRFSMGREREELAGSTLMGNALIAAEHPYQKGIIFTKNDESKQLEMIVGSKLKEFGPVAQVRKSTYYFEYDPQAIDLLVDGILQVATEKTKRQDEVASFMGTG